MCGIFGYIGDPSTDKQLYPDRRKFIERAAYISALRGTDGTGLGMIGYDNTVDVYKTAMPAYNFLEQRYVSEVLLLEADKYRLLLGHCRAKTNGVVSKRNSHPFKSGPITLVHNGVISNISSIVPRDSKYLVDSEGVADLLASVTNPVPVLESLMGSYVLVWHDARDGVTRIARNEERPLYMASTANDSLIYFMSDGRDLAAVLAPITYDTKKGVRYFKTSTLYELPADSPATWREVPFTIKKYWSGNNGNWSGFPGNSNQKTGGNGSRTTGTNKSEVVFHAKGRNKESTVEFTVGSSIPVSLWDGEVKNNWAHCTGECDLVDIMEYSVVLCNPDLAFTEEVRLSKDIVEGTATVTGVDKTKGIIWTKDFVKKEDTGTKVLSLAHNTIEYVRGPGGTKISRAKFSELAKSGCSSCTANIYSADADSVFWVNETTPLCPTCSAND